MVFVCFLDLDFWVLEMIWMVKQSISNHLELQMTFWNKIPKTDNCAARIKISIAFFFSFSRWDFHRSDLLLSEGWVQLNSNLEASCKLYQQFLMTWQKEHFCSFVPARWARIAQNVRKPSQTVNVIYFDFFGFLKCMYPYGSLGVPLVPKSHDELVELFRFTRYVERNKVHFAPFLRFH